MMRSPLIALLILLIVPCATLADAAAPQASAEEVLYLQRVHVLNDVNGRLWKSMEDSGVPNVELARYAKEVSRLGVTRLRAWGAPTPELASFHDRLVDLHLEMGRFYGAVAESNFGLAMDMGGRIEKRMIDFQSAWERVERRYR